MRFQISRGGGVEVFSFAMQLFIKTKLALISNVKISKKKKNFHAGGLLTYGQSAELLFLPYGAAPRISSAVLIQPTLFM